MHESAQKKQEKRQERSELQRAEFGVWYKVREVGVDEIFVG